MFYYRRQHWPIHLGNFCHWMSPPLGPWIWQGSLSRRPASHDREHPALAQKEYKNCIFGLEYIPHCLQCFCGWSRQLRFPYLRSWACSLWGTPAFYLPYDKVLHLAAAHNLHHKVLFIHGSSCFDIGISTDPFIWEIFATGCYHPWDHEFGKVLCLGDMIHMIRNIQHWHGSNIRILSLVKNLFHIVYSVPVDDQGNCNFLR